MESLIHVANVFYLFAYLVRDILWLRLLTVMASVCLSTYFFFRTEPLMPPIYWNLVFTSINVYWILLLLLERRPVHFKEAERKLYQMVFRTLTPREMQKLLNFAAWERAAPSQRIVKQGAPLDRIMVIYSGHVSVQVDGMEVAQLKEGQFIGEMSFLTDATTSASVVARDDVEYVAWPQHALKRFLDRNPELRAALQMVIGVDLAAKLRR